MNNLDKAMKNLKESKKIESEKLAKLVEKKVLKESVQLTSDEVDYIQKQINSIIAYNQDPEISGNNLSEEEAIKYMEDALNDPYGEEGFFQDDALYENIDGLNGDNSDEYEDEILRVAKEYFNMKYKIKEENKLTESGNYGGLTNASDDVLFTSIANTEVYERLQGIRDYLNDYAKILRGDRTGEYAEDDELINEAAYYVREALETLDRAWADQENYGESKENKEDKREEAIKKLMTTSGLSREEVLKIVGQIK